MPNARIVNFTFEDVVVPTLQPVLSRFLMEGLSRRSVWESPDVPMTNYGRKEYEGLRFNDGLGNQVVYYFNFDDVKLAMPLIEGIINSRLTELQNRVYELQQSSAIIKDKFESLEIIKDKLESLEATLPVRVMRKLQELSQSLKKGFHDRTRSKSK